MIKKFFFLFLFCWRAPASGPLRARTLQPAVGSEMNDVGSDGTFFDILTDGGFFGFAMDSTGGITVAGPNSYFLGAQINWVGGSDVSTHLNSVLINLNDGGNFSSSVCNPTHIGDAWPWCKPLHMSVCDA